MRDIFVKLAKLKFQGLAEIAQAIGTGPEVAMGASVKKTTLVPRKRKRNEEVLETIEIEDDAEDKEEVKSQPRKGKGDGPSAGISCHPGSYPGFSGQAVTPPGFSGQVITDSCSIVSN